MRHAPSYAADLTKLAHPVALTLLRPYRGKRRQVDGVSTRRERSRGEFDCVSSAAWGKRGGNFGEQNPPGPFGARGIVLCNRLL